MAKPVLSGTRILLTSSLAYALVACGVDQTQVSDKTPVTPGETSFVSKVPYSQQGRGDDALSGAPEAADGAAATGGSTSAPTTPGQDGSMDPARAIAEADIIKVEGTTLFALSRYSGLSVIDVSDPGHLRSLGNHRTNAIPFEMYVEEGRAYVMYTGWGHYEVNSESGVWSWTNTSRVQALDVSNPAEISVIGEHDVPGDITDSRKVGEVLYLVTFENGYCWQCDTTVNTRVTSFDVSVPDEFELIDELRLSDASSYGGKRSIAVTEDRIYISGRDWNGTEKGVIDVVDISDAAGDLVRGAEVSIAGPIDSRWQIDEFDGILRVISQPGGWSTVAKPIVETFAVESSQTITPLASLDMVLPPNEFLRSVRFDGTRAYAITMEQKDPLFTFDLSDPAAPKQLGELVIPGWVYHMEPRGDRVYALGFDDAVNGGALHVSLFDVSELSEPKQLARVNFGGQWASFSEDQDRIHKAFNIMADQGLILVPFSGWDYSDKDASECSYGTYLSGIQLIDMSTESLTLRGLAPQVGQARRGFLVQDALFGVSDNSVQTFDIQDRDQPKALDSLETARNISQIRVMGDSMLRFGSDWWTGRTTLDFTALSSVESAEPLGDIDLDELAPPENGCEQSAYWEGQVLVQGNYAYVPRRVYKWDNTGSGESHQELVFYVVDITDRTAPKVVNTFAVKSKGDSEALAQVVKTDQALLVGRYSGYYSYSPAGMLTSQPTFSYDIYTLADPANPTLASNIEVPQTLAYGGYGYNVTGCMIDVGWGWWRGYGAGQTLVSGDVVVSQHQEPLDDGTGRVRYYLDRMDVSEPSEPKLLTKVNIPGGVVDFDSANGRTVTLDYLERAVPGTSWDDCRAQFGDYASYNFDYEKQLCVSYRRILNTLVVEENVATLVDSAAIDSEDGWASNVAVTRDRVFANYASYDPKKAKPHVRALSIGASGSNLGELEELGSVDLEGSGYGYGYLVARGQRAFLSESGLLTVIDAQGKDELNVTRHEMNGYYCESLEVTENAAYCALSYQGVQAFPLD
jgi:hypothetical protein